MRSVEQGLTIKQACKAASITTRTYQRWRARWREFKSAMDEAYKKGRETRYEQTMAEVQAAKEARLSGEPIPRQAQPERKLNYAVASQPLVSGTRWFNIECNFWPF